MQSIAIFLGLFILAGAAGESPAELSDYRPPIAVQLRFTKDRPRYRCDEKVGIIITVANTSDRPLRVSRDSIRPGQLFLHLRIIDPAGRLLTSALDKPRREAAHVPPLPFVEDPGTHKLVMAAPCALFAPGPLKPEEIPDLARYYSLEMSGPYSAQAQLSIMEFAEDGVCNPKKYRWLGVLKSEPTSFFIEGRLPIRIHPAIWHLDWKDNDPGRNVVIRIPIPAGNTAGDFRKEIHLQNMKGLKAEADQSGGMLEVRFRGRQCIESLQDAQPGCSYRVVVSGQYANGRPFCGSRRITIAK